jgi:type IV secretion system protein VirB10
MEARLLRARRYQQTVPLSSSTPSKVSLEDPHYQVREPKESADISTLPVKRNRILTNDMRIFAVLEDALNSQLPGRVIAVVSRNVFSMEGEEILIPAYSKVVCRYEGAKKQGQTRLQLDCKRIIRPDGVSIHLTDALAADQMGRTGVFGDVDNRFWEKYGAAFLVTGLSAVLQMGASMASDKMREGAGQLSQNLGSITSEVLEKNLDMMPVITVPSGSTIQIIPERDIYLREVKNETHPN